jgi:hypothetical protein
MPLLQVTIIKTIKVQAQRLPLKLKGVKKVSIVYSVKGSFNIKL